MSSYLKLEQPAGKGSASEALLFELEAFGTPSAPLSGKFVQ